MAKKSEFNDTFTLSHSEKNGHFLTVSPAIKSEGFEPIAIEITSEQWDKLRFHFITAMNDKNKESLLAYL